MTTQFFDLLNPRLRGSESDKVGNLGGKEPEMGTTDHTSHLPGWPVSENWTHVERGDLGESGVLRQMFCTFVSIFNSRVPVRSKSRIPNGESGASKVEF